MDENINSFLSNEELALEAIVCSKSNIFEENDDMVCLEEDMELLELEDTVENNSIFVGFNQKETKSPVPRPCRTTNRRYTLPPQKRTGTTDCDNYTLARRRKSLFAQRNSCLETIFENPVFKDSSLILLGKEKLKRHISFDNFVSKTKIRHRKLKLKRLVKGRPKKNVTSEVSIEDLKLKLKSLEDLDRAEENKINSEIEKQNLNPV